MAEPRVETAQAKEILTDLMEHWPGEPDPHVFGHAKLLAYYLTEETTPGDFIHRYSLCLFIYFAETASIDTQSEEGGKLWESMQELIQKISKIAFGAEFEQAVQDHLDAMEALKQRIGEIVARG